MSLVTSSVLVLWFLGFWIFHALCKMKKKLNSRKLNYCGFAQYFYWISAHFQVLYPHRHWQPTVAGIFVYFKYAVIPFSIFSKSHNVIHIMLIQVQHLNKVLYVVASKLMAMYLKQHFQQVSCSVGFGWEVKTGWEGFISTWDRLPTVTTFFWLRSHKKPFDISDAHIHISVMLYFVFLASFDCGHSRAI